MALVPGLDAKKLALVPGLDAKKLAFKPGTNAIRSYRKLKRREANNEKEKKDITWYEWRSR